MNRSRKGVPLVPTLAEVRKDMDYEMFVVGIYWLGEGYGGLTRYETEAKAMAHAKGLVKKGYDKPGKSEIHVYKTKRTTLAVVTKSITEVPN